MATVVASIASDRDRIGELAVLHMERSLRGLLKDPSTTIEPGFLRLHTGESHALGNLTMIGERDDPESVREAVGPLLAEALTACVCFRKPAPLPTREMLRSHGFDLEASLPAMAVDIDQLANTSLPAGFEFIKVKDPAEAESWAEAVAAGYPIPIRLARMFSQLVLGFDDAEDASAQWFSIVKDGECMATSLLYLSDGVAGVYCVATLPEQRGKGLGAHITAEPLRVAHKLGYRVGVLQSSQQGHPIYQRLGFQDVGAVSSLLRIPK